MTQAEVLGRRGDLDVVLRVLQGLRTVQVTGAPGPDLAPGQAPDGPVAALVAQGAEVAALRSRVQALLDLVPAAHLDLTTDGPDDNHDDHDHDDEADRRLRALLGEVEPIVRGLLTDRDALRREEESLPGFVAALGALEPLVPELRQLTDHELAAAHLATVALVLDDPDGRVVEQLRRQLAELLGDRHLLVTTEPASHGVGCLLVTSTDRVAEVERLLGADQISRVSVPGEYAGRSLGGTVTAMRAELAALPELVARNDAGLVGAVLPAAPTLGAADRRLAARAERLAAAQLAAVGARTFAMRMWLPREARDRVRRALDTQVPGPVVLSDVPDPTEQPPVVLRNPRVARPFERLVGFLAWPRQGEVDPTLLMAVMFPFMFGVMVGDVAYGLILAGAGLLLRRRLRDRSPFLGDIARVLFLGGCWSVVFGFLFGELLGGFGHYVLGFPALWFYRGSPDALAPLLTFVLAIGAVHTVLGLLLGVWTSVRERHLRHAAERVGTLIVLIGLFGIAGVAAARLPGDLMTPAVAVLVIGLVVAVAAPGGAGGLLAPLELIGTIGNILSYLRLAAVGLASVYLALVANELGSAAPLLLGIVVAAFFHALNIALAAFSPMVQSLRLHYVEFFPKFYEGGGQPFEPLGAARPTRPSRSVPNPPPQLAPQLQEESSWK
jgi:V/A-type H+/Na+-transporting ATPase subunit I